MFHTLEDILSPLEEEYQADVLDEINNIGSDPGLIISASAQARACGVERVRDELLQIF